MKWAVLVSRPTITQIESCFQGVRGKPTMKSMLMSSHFHAGIDKGCIWPAVFRWLALILWHVSQPDTYSAISPFIFDHQKFSLRSRYILVLPGWMVNLEIWASSKISFFNSRSWGMTNLWPNHTTPLSSLRKQLNLGSPSDNFCMIFWSSSSMSWAKAILSWRGDSIETA
jgi:hypothetical protein